MENSYEKARRAVKEALLNEDWKIMDEVFEEINKEEPFNLVPESVRVPSPFVENKDIIKTRAARQTIFFMGLMPICCPDSSMWRPIMWQSTYKVTFLDVAVALAASAVFDEFSVKYMPLVRRSTDPNKIRINKLFRFMEELGFANGSRFTGIGIGAAKALVHSVATRSSNATTGFYLSSVIANTLLIEIEHFLEYVDNVREIIMEANARYRRLREVVENWIKTAPRLYLRDTRLYYDWNDAVKDVIIEAKKRKKDFEFTL